jgi:hypothetical protein
MANNLMLATHDYSLLGQKYIINTTGNNTGQATANTILDLLQEPTIVGLV